MASPARWPSACCATTCCVRPARCGSPPSPRRGVSLGASLPDGDRHRAGDPSVRRIAESLTAIAVVGSSSPAIGFMLSPSAWCSPCRDALPRRRWSRSWRFGGATVAPDRRSTASGVPRAEREPRPSPGHVQPFIAWARWRSSSCWRDRTPTSTSTATSTRASTVHVRTSIDNVVWPDDQEGVAVDRADQRFAASATGPDVRRRPQRPGRTSRWSAPPPRASAYVTVEDLKLQGATLAAGRFEDGGHCRADVSNTSRSKVDTRAMNLNSILIGSEGDSSAWRSAAAAGRAWLGGQRLAVAGGRGRFT